MKKIIVFAGIAALAAASCTKGNTSVSDNVNSEENTGSITTCITVNAEGDITKSTTPGNDASIASLQVFVFNNDDTGLLETSGTATGSKITLNCKTGNKVFYAVVNAPSLSVTSLADLKGQVSLLSDNGLGKLVMVGAKEESVPASADIKLTVKRIAAKFVIDKVTAAFTNSTYQNMVTSGKFKITSIFLVNMATKNKYDIALTALDNPEVIHTGKSALTTKNALGYDDVNAVVNTTYTQAHTFYAYPNASSTKTRLAVAAQLDDKTYYYPITFNEVKSNTLYRISNLTITRPGADTPDTIITTEDCSFEITVEEWTENSSNETI